MPTSDGWILLTRIQDLSLTRRDYFQFYAQRSDVITLNLNDRCELN